ncbi:MAG: DUF2851 family protein [Muribaculaceae bacterium]|nr:DUF2851 family protein [Muribaculaceae bacterium]
MLQTDLATVDGEKISIVDPGILNRDSGPDFFNAKICIGGRMWAGDVEIHVRATDWHRHGHDGDPAYDSVVLHVVDRDDGMIHRSNGETIPQMVMRCAPEFHRRYSELVDRSDIDLPCAPHISTFSSLHITDWLTALAFERVYAKADRMLELLDTFTGDWEQVAYVTLARALGFGKNSDAMERLATSIPLRFLRKHADSSLAMEAIFFGQSGFLDSASSTEPYVAQLKREYGFLAGKFSLRRLPSAGWKMGRMRPQNLPHRRIATLAAMMAGDFRIVAHLLKMQSPEDAIEYFRTPLDGYWANHFTFGTPASKPCECMSRASAMLLVINTVVPLFMAYGCSHGDDSLIDKAVEWLRLLPAESNSIIAMFGRAGINCSDAFTSQALIQLRRAYCEPHRCLYCRLGHTLLARHALRRNGK